MALEAAEVSQCRIKVKVFKSQYLIEEEFYTVEKAIEFVKENERMNVCKIIIPELEKDIVFNSKIHDIDEWERQYNLRKELLRENSEWECSYGNPNCYEHDICLQCQFDQANGV